MNNTELEKIIKLIPCKGEPIDWNGLGSTCLSLLFDKMSKTYQNPKYHGEIDVLTHTKMVCEEIVN